MSSPHQIIDTADPHRSIAFTYDPLDRLLTETTSLGTAFIEPKD